jgi:hypothetical protein
MSGVFRNIDPPPPRRPASVCPPPPALLRCYLKLFSPYKLLGSVMFSNLHTLPDEKKTLKM